jgi:hypothetical protein
MKDMLNAQD